MIESIGIGHWHMARLNGVEVTFYRNTALNPNLRSRRYKPTPASYRRLHEVLWPEIVHGCLQMTPCYSGTPEHQTYFVDNKARPVTV